jgi:Fic family protein
MNIPQSPPELMDLVRKVSPPERFLEILGTGRPLVRGKYLHWDELRHRRPPKDLTLDEWWLVTKSARSTSREELPLLQESGSPFYFVYVAPMRQHLHEIDQSFGIGHMPAVTPPGLDAHGRKHFLVSSLMEEAIRSSQLEGASTTRARAKEMIRGNKPPRNKSDRMILNNFHAMERIESLAEEPLTPEVVFELHSILAEGTLDDPAKAGVFRTEADEVVVELFNSVETAHVPPPASQLPTRLDLLIEFANGDSIQDWLHPVLRAVILHFMVGYDHPFVDGNGRVARALFYWAMIRHGYPQVKYLSISQILREAPAKYQRAYLLTETDDGDQTYFILHQLVVLIRSIRSLEEYVQRKLHRARDIEKRLKGVPSLNHRELALLSHALRHPGQAYSVRSHQSSHRVVANTARSDLEHLADQGLLLRSKQGRAYSYVAPSDLEERISALPAA